MNIKYFYEFRGLDEVLNRVEILSKESVTPEEITGASEPFVLDFPEIKKLDPVQSSGAKLNVISKTIFQFIDLHTDDMQRYVVKFFRAGLPYWIGYLDSELYEEDLSRFPPYPVSFSASDFNILERLKFLDAEEKHYTDIAPLIVQLKRCFDRLALPFQNLYVGCSTIAEGITLAATETVLHRLNVQSANFYDEDNEPMDCREVLESILEPFGLTIVQRSSNIIITDLNSIKANALLKVYDFETLQYKREERAGAYFGDMYEIGFASTDATLEFEEMINNVKITSSPYISTEILTREIRESSFDGIDKAVTTSEYYRKDAYTKCPDWHSGESSYLVYTDKNSNNTLIGADIKRSDAAEQRVVFDFPLSDNFIIATTGTFYLNIKLSAYINTKSNPFDTKIDVEQDRRARMLCVRCNLFLCNSSGKPLAYYTNTLAAGTTDNPIRGAWLSINDFTAKYDRMFSLVFANKQPKTGAILNNWITNSNARPHRPDMHGYSDEISDKFFGAGVFIPLKNVYDLEIPGEFVMDGFLRLEITNDYFVRDPDYNSGFPEDYFIYPEENIKELLINNLTISIADENHKGVTAQDYEFKSYVNKSVAADFEDKELKIVSCNEEQVPVGRGNLLVFKEGRYKLQLKYTRAGQTDNLERLLMCSIHSNFATKNRVVAVDIKGCDCPAGKYVTYNGVFGPAPLYVQGCNIDFANATTRICTSEFSADTAKLSNIPYDS